MSDNVIPFPKPKTIKDVDLYNLNLKLYLHEDKKSKEILDMCDEINHQADIINAQAQAICDLLEGEYE